MIKFFKQLFCRYEKPKCNHRELTFSYGNPQYYQGDYWYFASSYYLTEQDIQTVKNLNHERIDLYKKIKECSLGIGKFEKDYLGFYGRSTFCPDCKSAVFEL